MERLRSIRHVILLGAAIWLAGCSTRPAPMPAVSAPVAATRPTPAPRDPAALAEKLRPLLHRLDATGTTVACRVIELPSGRELYAERADDPVIPASNLKVSVSAAALDRFGPEYRLKTYLAIDGDDLWLIGTGDPAPGDPKIADRDHVKPNTMLDRWAQALAARGVKRIRGNLYFYDGAFDDIRVHPTWSRSFLTDWYAAPVSGLNFNDNCIDVTVAPGSAGEPATFDLMPPASAAVRIVNRTTSARVSGGANAPAVAATPAIERQRNANVFTISGTVTARTALESKAVIDPGAFFADALRTNLATHGITIDGKTQRADKPLGSAEQPPGQKIVAVHETSMRDILWRINKNSQNLFAEAICKYLGRDWSRRAGNAEAQGSWESGGAAVRAFLAAEHIDESGFTYIDGSGLARGNRVTTRGQTELLLAMARHRYADAFYESLTIAGRDGTLTKRMTDIAGRVRGKTGSIGGVRALSAYVDASDGARFIVSVILNDIPAGQVKAAEALADDVCRLLAE